MTNIKELSDANPDGTRLGQSATDKIAFFGATPVAQQGGTALAVSSAAYTAITGSGAYGWTYTQAMELQNMARACATALTNLGLTTDS